MKKSLKVLVLTAVIASNFTSIGFASPVSKTAEAKKLKKEKIEVKQPTKEERIKQLEERIETLEKVYEEGSISKETYEAKKANFNEMLQNIKDGKYELYRVDNSKKKQGKVNQLTKEERIKLLEEDIQKLEKKYEEGSISKETYDAKKANFNQILEALKNGKEKSSKADSLKVEILGVDKGKKKAVSKALTNEEQRKNLEESIQKLEVKYKDGLISKETYDAKKAHLKKILESICELNEITVDNIKNYKAGMNEVSINVNGENRRFKFYVPENLPSEGVSLVFRFHGSVSTSQDPIGAISKNYILNQIANDENIIVVYPAGSAGENDTMITWNDTKNNLDFFDEMVKCFEETFDNIDSNRIYTCGHSSGAIFSFALAGFREDKIAAAVPVSGQYNLTKHPEKATFTGNEVSVPIRAYNGTKDGSVNHQAACDNMRVWAEKENKGSSSNIEESSLKIDDYEVNVKRWNGGISDLEMYSIQGEGHGISWNTIAQSMWEFMKNNPKNN